MGLPHDNKGRRWLGWCHDFVPFFLSESDTIRACYSPAYDCARIINLDVYFLEVRDGLLHHFLNLSRFSYVCGDGKAFPS